MTQIKSIKAKPNKKIVFDPKGFFVIFLKNEEIIVEHYINVSKATNVDIDSGKLNIVIVGDNALSIGQTIVREGLISRVDHGIFMGRELMKAEIALKNNLVYEQCKDLSLKIFQK